MVVIHINLFKCSTFRLQDCPQKVANEICFVCGKFIKVRATKYFVQASIRICEAYKAYFGMPVGDHEKSWGPHFVCNTCKKTLRDKRKLPDALKEFHIAFYFEKKKVHSVLLLFRLVPRGKRTIKFAVPRIWREPTNHSSDCYFCSVDPVKRRAGKNAPAIVYPGIPSSIAPVQHSAQLAVLNPPSLKREQTSGDESSILKNEEGTSDCEDYITGDELTKKSTISPSSKI